MGDAGKMRHGLRVRSYRRVVGMAGSNSRARSFAAKVRPETFGVLANIARHRNLSISAIVSDLLEQTIAMEWDIGEDLPESVFDGWRPYEDA